MARSIKLPEEAIKDLRKLAKGVLRDTVYPHLRTATDAVRDEAKRLAPVKTGALRDSIKARTWREDLSGVVYADYPNTGRVTKSRTKKQRAGARVYYATVVEYGRRKANADDSEKRPGARPFLRPAVKAKQRFIRKELTDAMKEALKDV